MHRLSARPQCLALSLLGKLHPAIVFPATPVVGVLVLRWLWPGMDRLSRGIVSLATFCCTVVALSVLIGWAPQ